MTGAWGTRGRQCLICCAALPAEGPCACDFSTVISLADPEERARLERQIHGPPTVWHDVRTIVRSWWRWLGHTRPRAPDRFALARWGTIRDAAVASPPWGGAPCTAYAIELRDRVRRVLVDAWTLGFVVELDDGRRARVPPGRVELELTGAPVVDVAIAAYLRDVVLAPGPRPFRYRALRVRTLRPGDRVAVCGRWTEGEALRDAPALIPIGPARLK